MLAAGSAASLAALLIWLGPPGNDLAAHVYQRTVFLHHGFQLWNNFWYGGRYGFVNVQRPLLPAGRGVRDQGAGRSSRSRSPRWHSRSSSAGSSVPLACWSSRTFAVVWSLLVISAAFPFALGFALGLLALVALQAGRRWLFGILAVLTVAASPLAFLLSRDLPRGHRARDARAGQAPDRPRCDPPLRRRLPVPAHASVRRRRPLPVLGVRAPVDPHLLRPRGAAHLARRARARASAGSSSPTASSASPPTPSRLRSARTSRASGWPRSRSRCSCSRSGAGARCRWPRSCSCSPRCGTSARTPGRSPAARASTKRPSAVRTGSPRLEVPAQAPDAVLPGRGGRHRRPLGGRLPAREPGSRSRAAGSVRTTSRRTRCSTTT